MQLACRLLMFSGGLDSTYVLKKFLTETDGVICVHHIHLANPDRRGEAETKACQAIIDYCKANYRTFFYSESNIDRTGMTGFFGFDVMTVSFEAGIAAVNFKNTMGVMPTEWYFGECLEDLDSPYQKMKNRAHCLRSAMQAGCWPEKPPQLKTIPWPTKLQTMQYLAPDLVDMCWTCRNPRSSITGRYGFRECGRCHTCKMVDSTRRDL